MNKYLVEYEFEDGTQAIFESDYDEIQSEDNGVWMVSGDGEDDLAVLRSSQKFEAVTSRFIPVAQTVLNSLKEIDAPKEVEVEFGLKFSAKASGGKGLEAMGLAKRHWPKFKLP